jgi:hypothetical protein
MKQTMNKKTKILSIMLLVVFLAAPLTNSYAFLTKKEQQATGKQSFGTSQFENRNSSSTDNRLRAGAGGGGTGDPLNPGGAATDPTDHVNDGPLGDGLWVLLALAMGYGVLRLSRNKKRDLNVNIY